MVHPVSLNLQFSQTCPLIFKFKTYYTINRKYLDCLQWHTGTIGEIKNFNFKVFMLKLYNNPLYYLFWVFYS